MTSAPTTRTGSPTADQRRKPAQPSRIPNLIDCGSGKDFGICPACNRGHGYIVFQRNPDPKPTAAAIGLRYSR